MVIELNPTPMTPEVMKDLESRGLILRLCPGAHSAKTGRNQSNSEVIYASDPAWGPHKLIVATINALEPYEYFGTHADNEEFLLIGDPNTKPICLIVALCKKGEFEKRIRDRLLTANDFIALRMIYNDPEVSFFVMYKDVPHGEVTVDGPGRPGSFYVTEPRDLVIEKTDLMDYRLKVNF